VHCFSTSAHRQLLYSSLKPVPISHARSCVFLDVAAPVMPMNNHIFSHCTTTYYESAQNVIVCFMLFTCISWNVYKSVGMIEKFTYPILCLSRASSFPNVGSSCPCVNKSDSFTLFYHSCLVFILLVRYSPFHCSSC
jgi:hypothetical protein